MHSPHNVRIIANILKEFNLETQVPWEPQPVLFEVMKTRKRSHIDLKMQLIAREFRTNAVEHWF